MKKYYSNTEEEEEKDAKNKATRCGTLPLVYINYIKINGSYTKEKAGATTP